MRRPTHSQKQHFFRFTTTTCTTISFNDSLTSSKSACFDISAMSLSENDEKVYLSALQGNLDEVRKYVNGGGNVFAGHPSYHGDTPLHAACANGHLDVCKYLGSVGANEHQRNNKGNVPLHYAAKHGHLKVVTYLIYNKTADVNVKNKYGTTPLHLASKRGSGEILKFLIKNGADVNARDSYRGGSPLHWACEAGKIASVNVLLSSKKVNIKLLNKKQENVVMMAAKKGFAYLCQVLLLREKNTAKALFSSSQEKNEVLSSSDEEFDYDERAENVEGSPDIEDAQEMEEYVKPGSKNTGNNNLPLLEQKNRHGETALYIACYSGFSDVVTLLLICMQGNKFVRDKNGEETTTRDQSLRVYSRKEIANMINLMVESRGKTAILIVAWRGFINVLSTLLQYGGDASIPDKKGKTALHYAAERGHENITKRLIAAGTLDLDTRDHEGSTALHKAAVFGNDKIARYLVNARANLDILNNDGRTALYNSTLCNRGSIAQFLIDNGANVNLSTPAGNSPLHKAAYSGDAMTMLKLIGKGANIFAKNRQGISALDIAEQRKHRACFDILNELTFKRAKSTPDQDTLDNLTRSYSPPPPGSPKTFHLSPPVSPDGVYHRSDSPKGRRRLKQLKAEKDRRLKAAGSSIVNGEKRGKDMFDKISI